GDESCLFELSSDSGYNDGSWHNVESKFYGNPTNPTLDLYVDGSLEATTKEWLCPMLDEDFETAKIGQNSNNESDYFEGVIDEVKIYKNYEPDQPPSDPTISGEQNGNVGTSYEYTFTSTDPEGGTVSYYIKWGDGDITDWTTPQASGTPYKESHTWSESGTYTIEAKARDTQGAESNWGTLTVEISSSEANLKIRLNAINIGQVSANIENVGVGSVSDIEWDLTVEGGLFRLTKRINANATGTIETLGAGETQTVQTPDNSITLKFGMAKVTVTATVGDQTFNHEQYVLVIGRLIFARPLILRP
ncbi:hypothetical protein KAR91_69600, partial [Candidatus Pacearchaeota archaeon]|nr:hypothetical protein [Candidatus Pacearchaeota archaeon]